MLSLKRRRNPWIGMGAGFVGGIAGSVAMGQFLHLWSRLSHSNLEEEGMQSTVKAASAVSEKVLSHPLTEEEKPKAASAVHFGFGGLVGALYGATAATTPAVSMAMGAPFGASVYLGAHAAAVPALGLGTPVTGKPVMDEVGELLGHLLYGLVTEVTRRGVVTAANAVVWGARIARFLPSA
jgi:putative membrane protein